MGYLGSGGTTSLPSKSISLLVSTRKSPTSKDSRTDSLTAPVLFPPVTFAPTPLLPQSIRLSSSLTIDSSSSQITLSSSTMPKRVSTTFQTPPTFTATSTSSSPPSQVWPTLQVPVIKDVWSVELSHPCSRPGGTEPTASSMASLVRTTMTSVTVPEDFSSSPLMFHSEVETNRRKSFG